MCSVIEKNKEKRLGELNTYMDRFAALVVHEQAVKEVKIGRNVSANIYYRNYAVIRDATMFGGNISATYKTNTE